MKTLSARLDLILAALEPCALLADIGTDHGLLPIAAVQRGVATQAIAADLRTAPLVAARRNIEGAQVMDRVTVVQVDGILPLAGRGIDALVMAGMSARLMIRLCSAAPQVLAHVRQLVVQPNRDAPMIRAWALEQGWHLGDEAMVYERGRFFIVCSFAPGQGADPAYDVPEWTQADLCMVGPHLLTRRDPIASNWYDEQRARLLSLVGTGLHKLEPELALWQRATDAMATARAFTHVCGAKRRFSTT